jgi:nitrogen fixation protein NifU and related proteins
MPVSFMVSVPVAAPDRLQNLERVLLHEQRPALYQVLFRLKGQEQGEWFKGQTTGGLRWGILHKGLRQMSELEKMISKLTHKSYGSRDEETSSGKIKFGVLPHATSSARVTGPCGETMEIYLQIDGEEIKDGSFFTDGCGASRLCGSLALMLAIGNNLDDAAMIEGDTLLGMIENLPEDHRHCAYLAAGTLQTALHNYVAEPEHRHHSATDSREN